MKHVLPLLLAFSFMVSSCSPAPMIPESTAGSTIAPSATAIPSITPTITATSLPTAAPTPTLSPDPNIYQFDANVSSDDRELIVRAVQTGRYYLINNFGSDISTGIKIIIKYDPNGNWAGHLQKYFLGHGPIIELNTAHPFWKGETHAHDTGGVIHELTHWWESERGCLTHSTSNPASTTWFMLEGAAQYAGLMASGQESELDPGLALGEWQRSEWNATLWFTSSIIGPLAIKKLIDEHGPLAYIKWCDLAGPKGPAVAFKSVYGLDVQDFRYHCM